MADLKPSTGTLSQGTGTEDSQGSEETAAELTPTPGVPPGGANPAPHRRAPQPSRCDQHHPWHSKPPICAPQALSGLTISFPHHFGRQLPHLEGFTLPSTASSQEPGPAWTGCAPSSVPLNGGRLILGLSSGEFPFSQG